MALTEFMLVTHAIAAEIDTTPESAEPTWVKFGAGIENFSESLNEVVQQYFFFSDGPQLRDRPRARVFLLRPSHHGRRRTGLYFCRRP